MNKLRKFLVIGVMVMTVFATMGMVTPNVEAAASAGDLIKMDGLSSVYYLGADGKRYVFPNTDTYMSWYSDFSGVVTIPASELQSYPLGGNVVMRPGTKLVKITTDPTVYAVEPNGTLRSIVSEANATALFGTNWNKRVVDVADAFFTNYTIGAPLTVGQVPAGSLVKTASSADVYYYDGTNYRSIASEAAFHANRFQFGNVLTVSNAITAGGTVIASAELVNVAQGGTPAGPVVTGSGLMVSLNAGTPVAMNIPASSTVEFLKINLTAANDGPVNVSSIKLTAYGLSDAGNIKEVTFYDNGVKVGTSRAINSSDRNATFNFATPIYIPAGSTKTLVVKANVIVNSGSYGLGIAAASDIVSTGATVSGSFPVQGNLMSAVDGTAVGSINVTSNQNISYTASFGEDDVLLADFNISATGENALLSSIRLYNEGTRDNNVVSNLELFINGEKVANGTYADRYATFNFNYEIEKGDNVDVELRGDIGIANADDEIKFGIKDKNDVAAVGKTHGFAVSVTKATFNNLVKLTAGEFTIDMDKTAVPAKDVKPDTKNVVLAKISLKSNSENATLTEIKGADFFITQIGATNTIPVLENIRLSAVGGGTYDLETPTTISAGKITLSLDEEIVLTKGIAKVYELRADVKADAPEGTTLKTTLKGSALVIEGDVSGATIDDVKPGEVVSTLTTVRSASLSLNEVALTDVKVVGGANELVYKAMVEAGTADDVRIQSITIASTTGNAFTNNNISKLDIYLDGKLMSSLSNRITNGSITFSSLSNNVVLAGKEVALEVKATFSSTFADGATGFALQTTAVSARSVNGNKVVDAGTVTGASRNVTVATKGTLAIDMVLTDTKVKDSFLLAGSETQAGRYLGEIKFTTTNENVKVTKLNLTASSTANKADSGDLRSVKLVKADGTVVAEKTVSANGNVAFDPFNVTFDADKSTSLFIVVVAKGMNVAGDATATATSTKNIIYRLGAAEATGASSGEEISPYVASTTDSKIAYIVGSKLTSISNSLVDGKLTNGTNRTIAKYTLVFDNGSNREMDNEEMKAVLKDLVINVDKSADVALADISLYVDGSSSNKAVASASSTIASSTTAETVAWNSARLESLIDNARMDGSVTLVVTATVSGVVDRSWVSTDIFITGNNVRYATGGNTHNAYNMLPVSEVNGALLSD
jgi:hypothetical protein